ncbi:hypothetical protein LCGC14_0124730 [marine sediment metagenome]|uniref:Elp3/MiaA/NifB-like radical SAM core domain-containing protein n=1 Tax=marine sediment metagenome TaxID=412755 RepID=A0A0F9Y7T1_9ZZZZ
MELPPRADGDMLLKSGELTDIRRRLRAISSRHDLRSVIACSFDHRTRMLPFVFADKQMSPAGVRAIGSAMVDIGFDKTRIVLQQWNKHFRPSQMRLEGAMPDIFMVSSMLIHYSECRAMIQDACTIDPADRPLIIAGGPKIIYQPWDAFSTDPANPWGADVAVTGEEYVLLHLLEVLLSIRGDRESMRATFIRARDGGLLDEVPGLVYARGETDGVAEELIDTGIQRLVGDLDELPHPVLGYRLLEPPSRRGTLSSLAVADERVRRLSSVGSVVLTLGCRFVCPYCPIPAYNQRNYRLKSGERIADEMARLHIEYGIKYFFGADDNFFNDPQRTIEIAEQMVNKEVSGIRVGKKARWGTEATVFDTIRMKDHLRLMRKAGMRGLWMGVEDMTGSLIKKGQTVGKTIEAFRLLRERGICPMSMLMHHDSQPLVTFGRPEGLLNQIRLLRKAGSIDMQVLMITPATGAKVYEEAHTSGLAIESAGGRKVESHMMDGNYVIASTHRRPWRKQFNLVIAYMYFYHPLRFLWALVRPKSSLYLADCGIQAIGMIGLVKTIRRTTGWGLRLMFSKIKRHTRAPASGVPMRNPTGGPAAHAVPGTPQPLGAYVASPAEAPAEAPVEAEADSVHSA